MLAQYSTSFGRWGIVAALSLTVWMIEGLIVAPLLSLGGPNPGILVWAILFDCTAVPAFLAYAIVARPEKRSALTLLPILMLGIAIAGFFLPPEHRAPLYTLRFVFAPLELAVLGGGLWRLGKAFRRSRGAWLFAPDFSTRLESSLPRDASPALRLVAAELAVWHYGLFAWRIPTPVENDTTFSIADESGGLLAAIAILCLFEGLAEHLLLWHWSPRADLILLALSAYGLLYLMAEYNALRLRPVQLLPDRLMIRTGLRWHVEIPYAVIAEIRPVLSQARRRPSGYINAVGFGKPNLRLHLTETVIAHGPFGLRREARYIAVKIDRPDRFQEEITARMLLIPASATCRVR